MGKEEKVSPQVTKSIQLGARRISITDSKVSIFTGYLGVSIGLEDLGDALITLGVDPKDVFKDLKDMMVFDLPVPTFEQTVAMSDHRDRLQQAMADETRDFTSAEDAPNPVPNGNGGYDGPGVYWHYKGDRYWVIGIAEDEAKHFKNVVYRGLDDDSHRLWTRPLFLFNSCAIVDHVEVPRFRKIDESKKNAYVKTQSLLDDMVTIDLPKNAGWCRSEFPHPLLTLDFDETDRLCRIVAVGELARALRDF